MYGVEYGRGNRLFRVARPDEAGAALEFVAGVFHPTTPQDQFPPDSATAANEVAPTVANESKAMLKA